MRKVAILKSTLISRVLSLKVAVFCGLLAAFLFVEAHPSPASASGGFHINPFPTTGLAPNSVIHISGTGRLDSPQVFLEIPSGAVVHIPLRVNGEHFSGRVPLRWGRGVYRLELNRPSGYAWINTPLYVGVSSQGHSAQEVTASHKHRSATETIYFLSLLNEVRVRHGLRPFTYNPAASRLSQGHVQDNARAFHAFCHCYSNGTTFYGPFQREGFPIGGEVGAEATSVEIALNVLLHSPAHRELMLSPSYTSVGVGIASNYRGGYHDYLFVMDLLR